MITAAKNFVRHCVAIAAQYETAQLQSYEIGKDQTYVVFNVSGFTNQTLYVLFRKLDDNKVMDIRRTSNRLFINIATEDISVEHLGTFLYQGSLYLRRGNNSQFPGKIPHFKKLKQTFAPIIYP